MSAALQQQRGAAPFSRAGIFAVVLVGFAAFLAMLYFIGAGDTGGDVRDGPAHAGANGLNGYSALADMLEAEGIEVTQSRGREGFDTYQLLILTPRQFGDPEELTAILDDREYVGPTLIILPKWRASEIRGEISPEDEERKRPDWVELGFPEESIWPEELGELYRFEDTIEELGEDEEPAFEGLGASGNLPTNVIRYAQENASHQPLIRDAAGHVLAFQLVGEESSDYYNNSHWVTFVVEPDLMNNFGLEDGNRAAAAMALIRSANYGDEIYGVTFDMTLQGQGNSTNLLTLAFQPPFLAATLCLILAMLIVGWRAFMRFGANAVSGPQIAFGKQRLVTNGAGLVVRAKRLGLLAGPYTALTERRIGRALGLTHPDAESIDQALRTRLPDEESFSERAARLENASRPIDILRAAQSLNELTNKLTGKHST